MSFEKQQPTSPARAHSAAANSMERLLTRSHIFFYRLSGGAIGGTFGNGPVLLLTSKGRKSGKMRVKPLIYVRDAGNLVLIASHGGAPTHPTWWLNLRADPHAEVQVKRQKLRVIASEATPDERARLWPQAVAIYPGYADYQKRTSRLIPVVILQPVDTVMLK